MRPRCLQHRIKTCQRDVFNKSMFAATTAIAAWAQQLPLGCECCSMAFGREQTEPGLPSRDALAATENPQAQEGPK